MSKFVLTAQLNLQAPKNTNKVLNQVRKQLSGVEIPVEVKGAKKAQDSLKKIKVETDKASTAATAMGRSFGLAIKRFAAFTVASRAVSLFTNSLAKAVDEAIDFQKEIVKISQVTGKSIKQLRGLQGTITSLATGLGTSSKDLLAVTRILSQAGIKANDLEVALKSLAKTTLAPTFDDITQTAEGAVAILSQFGQGVEKLESQLGAINAVAGQFAVESGDLIGAVRRFGGVFQAAGGELEELLAVFTAVRATTRESAESISTGLRTIFTRIQRPKTIEFLRQFGVELQNLDGTFVGPFEAAKRLSKALAGLGKGDLQFVQIAEELGGFRQIGKVIPLLQQFETAERARQAALAGGNSLTKDAETAQQALARQIIKVKEEFLALVRGISESTSFQLFAKVALQIASNLIKVADAIKPLLPLIAGLAAIKFSKGLGQFFSGAGSAVRGMQSMDPRKAQGFAKGGWVPGSGNRDTVPAMLTPGEFVVKKSSASKLGAGTLEAMNSNKYAKGGFVIQPENPEKFGALTIAGASSSIAAKGKGVSGKDIPALRSMIGDKLSNQAPQLSDEDLNMGASGFNTKGLAPINSGGFSNFLTKGGGRKFNKAASGKPKISKDELETAKAEYAKTLKSGKVKVPEDTSVAVRGPFGAFPIGGGKKMAVGENLKGNPIYSSFQKEISSAAKTALVAAAQDVAGKSKLPALLDIPPAFDADGEPPNKIFNQTRFLEGAQESIEGFILEGVVGAITNAKVGGGKTRFDFPSLDTNGIARDRLTKLFVDKKVQDLDRADAKRQLSTAEASDGGIHQKVASSLATEGFPFNIVKKPEGFNSGGGVGGPDTVPALLTPGEFVVNKQAAQGIGYSNLNSMNKTGVARFNSGGMVGPFQTFSEGSNGPVTRKQNKAEIKSGMAGVQNEIGTLARAIENQEKVVGHVTTNFEAADRELEALVNNSKGLSDAIFALEQSATPGAKGQKALNKLYEKLVVVEKEKLAKTEESNKTLEALITKEAELAEMQEEKAALISKAGGQKSVSTEAAQANLTSGTQTTFKDSAMNRAGNAAQQQKEAAVGATDDGKALSGFIQAAFGVTAALGMLKPEIDETSTGFERVTASVLGGLQGIVNSAVIVSGGLKALGINLTGKGIKDVLTGAKDDEGNFKGGAKAFSDGIADKFKGAGDAMQKLSKSDFFNKIPKIGGRLSKGLGGLGGQVSKLGPQVGNLATKFAGPIAAVGLMYQAVGLATSAIDAYTKVHEKAKKSVDEGNIEEAGENAVKSANAKVANNIAKGSVVAGAAIGSFFGPIGTVIGGAIGGLVGIIVKVADAFGLLSGPINFLRDTIGVAFGGDSTNTIKARARAEAAQNKVQKELAVNGREAANALQRVANGSQSFEEAYLSGALTGNFENQMVASEEARKLQASQNADTDKRMGTGGRAALGFVLGGPIGAAIMAATAPDKEAERREALGQRVEAEEKGAQGFTDAVANVFSRVGSDKAIRGVGGGDPEAIKKSVRESNKALDAELSLAEREVKALESKGKLTEEEKKLLAIQKGKIDTFNTNLDGAIKSGKRQRELIKALNFGLGGVVDKLSNISSRIDNISNFDQAGARFERAITDLDAAFSAASSSLNSNDLDKSISTIEDTLRGAGVSEDVIGRTSSSVRGFASANAALKEGSPEFKNIQKALLASGPEAGGIDNIKKVVGREITAGLDEATANQIKAAINSQDFDAAALEQAALGNMKPLREALDKVGVELNKELQGIIKERQKIESSIIKSLNDRKKSEAEFVAAQRKAIDLQLQAGKAFEEFGGAALTTGQKSSANLAKFNVGADVAGVGRLQSGSASDIQRVGNDIANRFTELQSGATNAAATGGTFGAGSGIAGAEADNRQQLKQLQQDLIATTQAEIQVRKEELSLIQKKNAAEKSSLEKLLQGDVAGFLEGQQTAGAAAALRSGDSGLASLFSSNALGSGLQSLEGTGLSDADTRRASELALGSVGITDGRSAGVLSGTTPEEERIKSEGRALAQTLGALGQQSAEFERQEIRTNTAIINAQKLELGKVNAQAQNLYKGGVVYANQGMFVPRGTDTVPAMLTPGEFVVNRSAVQRGNNLSILRAMNTGGGASGPGRMSGGGPVQYYNLGGIVESIGNAISGGASGLQGVFAGFSSAVEKLVNSQFSVKLDTTNVNVNFNGGSFLASMKEDIKEELLKEVQNEIGKFKPNTNGDLQKRDSVL